jgi:hypothetical protein
MTVTSPVDAADLQALREIDDYHVPVEDRFLGLDKRKIPLALVIIGIIALMTVILPAINGRLSYDDPVKPGDVLLVAKGITIVPPVGWGIAAGVRVGDEPARGVSASGNASVSSGSTDVAITVSEFSGTPAELLAQSNSIRSNSGLDDDKAFLVTGAQQTVTTRSGLTGVSEKYSWVGGVGTTYAFVIDEGKGKTTGVTITTTNDDDAASAAEAAQVTAMVDSLTFTGSAS